MPTLQDLHTFGPFLLIALCLLVGKAIKASKVPDWLIPVLLPVLGLVSGAATAAALGSDWRAWLEHSLLGLLIGSSAVGVHQAGRALARHGTDSASNPPSSPPPPAPPAPPAASPPQRGAGRPPGSMLMRRAFGASACAALLACAGAALCGCSAAPVVVEVATVVAVAATLAQTATQNVQAFVDAYFALHADAALQAKIDAVMLRVKDAAAALAALGNGTMYALEADYLQALAAFQAAYADALDAIKGLPMAQVVLSSPSSKATMGVAPKPGVMTLVAIPPSAFTPPAKRVSK